MRYIVFALLVFVSVFSVAAQADNELVVSRFAVSNQRDMFGIEAPILQGVLTNESRSSYTNINIHVDVLGRNGELIGEGFGYVTNACGTALLDFVLFPGQSVAFTASLELFTDSPTININNVQIAPDAEISDERPAKEINAFVGVTTVVLDQEIVAVEWIEDSRLRFGAGCDADVFTRLKWFEYNLDTGDIHPIEHPVAQFVTETMLRQAGLRALSQSGDENLFLVDVSRLTFHAESGRFVYQNDLHTLLTTERDGSFKRIVQDKLHQHSLRGFNFTPGGNGNFVAYYYGAYGDPVRYVVGSMDGKLLSAAINNVQPSLTVPGISPDAREVIIGGEFDGVKGYYLKNPLLSGNTLLFEVEELPGNNYPAPIYITGGAGDNFIFVIRPINGVASLQCFHRETNQLHTLTTLPLKLNTDERAWSWISPDGSKIAIAANGLNGGLWWVDLTRFEVCVA